jgi:hypothetical protein
MGLGVGAAALAVLLWAEVRDRSLARGLAKATCSACFVAVALSGSVHGRYGALPDPLVRWGAGLFFVSDLFVARGRFVRSGKANQLVGWPLFYAGQFLLAPSLS